MYTAKLRIVYVVLTFIMARKVHAKIGPSILNADLSRLSDESQKLLDSGADYIHLDVMDGTFVPNITFGHSLIKCLRKNIPVAFFESHMMVQEPQNWIEQFADAGVQLYTFHIEPCVDIPKTCRRVREAGMKVGLAIKPKTGVEAVTEYIEFADVILIMTVEPGFGGQKFMSDMMSKVKWLRTHYPFLDIEVDGGVGLDTIQQCAEAGANMIVSGTAVTGSNNPLLVINKLRDTVEDAISRYVIS